MIRSRRVLIPRRAGITLETEVSGMSIQAPDSFPVLSRGRHRRPKHGACFMEMASVLAGEKWSDHPPCTHPLLGELARLVNDNTSDIHRSELAVLVPSVVGLTWPDEDVRCTVGFTASVASYAVTRSPQPTQRALAAGLLTLQRVLDSRDLAAVPGTEGMEAAMASVPDEVRWARGFSDGAPVSDRVLRRRVAPAVTRSAVKGLVNGYQANPDLALRGLLEAAIRAGQALWPSGEDQRPCPADDRRSMLAAYSEPGGRSGCMHTLHGQPTRRAP